MRIYPETMFVLLIVIVYGVACAVVSGNMVEKKGYSKGAFMALGFIAGIIGVIVAAVLPDKRGGNADALLKYKELLDKGIITQEEFDMKKNELMQ